MSLAPHTDSRNTRRRFLTAREVSEQLALPLSSVYQHARQGTLPGVIRVGRRTLFDPDKLDSWLDRGGDRAAEPETA